MSSPSTPAPYMVDHKRGEVNELKQLLTNPKFLKDIDKRRDIIKKVIAYMTLGIDVSKVFSEMTMAAATKDLVQKKMVYHYLSAYAQQKSDLAILAINTLQKDCRDDDPMVRGLALRSLCSLRLPNLNEYVIMPLRASLSDQSPYVRKTAVLGVAKLFQYSPEAVKHSDLIDVLYNMLKDRDPLVISNAIHSLNEVLSSEGGMAINQNIILYLLNRIKEFNEWGQCAILELLSRYRPSNDSEMFDIMNLLEERLKHANAAVVFGCTKIFLHFTEKIPQVHHEVFKRLKAPMLTLMGGGSHELAYSVLSHILLLVQRAPDVFADSYKHFFCRFNDPSPVKQLKLQIATELANDKNFQDILNELSEYVTDLDSDISRYSIRSIGRVAIKVEAAAEESILHLLSFLELQTSYVIAETVIVLKDLLRKYPNRYEDVIPTVQKCFRSVDETEGKVAVLWLIGEYGDTIEDSPYILEDMINTIDEEESHAVLIQLLSTTVKLFFKRPPEVQSMLGKLLEKCIISSSKIDVRDRALLYYRLLSLDIIEAARVVNCPSTVVDVFAEQEDNETKTAVFNEFNTLSVVYGMPSARFIKKLDAEEKKKLEDEEAAEAAAAAQSNATSQILSEHDQSQVDHIDDGGVGGGVAASASSNGSKPGGPSSPSHSNSGGATLDLLGDFGFAPPPSSNGSSAPPPSLPQLEFIPAFTMEKSLYAQKWGTLPTSTQFELHLSPIRVKETSAVESALSAVGISTFASGVVDSSLKLYLFAKATNEVLFLIECIVNLQTGTLKTTVKTEGASSSDLQAMGQLFPSALQNLF